MKRLRFQLAVTLILGLELLRPAGAGQRDSAAIIGEKVFQLQSQVVKCLAGGCTDDPQVLWVLSRVSGNSRIIRALNSRPAWMEESDHRALLATLGALPPPEARLATDPPELMHLNGMQTHGPVLALEHATGYPGERLISILSPQLDEPRPAPRNPRQQVQGAGMIGAVFLMIALGIFSRKLFLKRAPTLRLPLSAESLHHAIYRSRHLRELGVNLSACIARITGCEVLFLEYNRNTGIISEIETGADGIHAVLSEVGLMPGRPLPEIPSLRSSVIRRRDTASYLAWPLLAATTRPVLLGVVLVLRPTARVRASASSIGIWVERAARYYRSILNPENLEPSRHV
jgi:hypothetical protein